MKSVRKDKEGTERVSWLVNLKGRIHTVYHCVDGRIILKWILGKYVGKCGLDASALG
jgi:hypothetical protein